MFISCTDFFFSQFWEYISLFPPQNWALTRNCECISCKSDYITRNCVRKKSQNCDQSSILALNILLLLATARVTLTGLHEIVSLLCLSTSIKEQQRFLTVKIWTSYLRLQEPFCATPQISHIFPHDWDFPVGGTPNPSSHPKQMENPDGNRPSFWFFPWCFR